MPNDLTSTELRSAAERLRQASYKPDWNIGSISYQQLADLLTIKDAYLRAHPADDEEPVDLEFVAEQFAGLHDQIQWAASKNGKLVVRAYPFIRTRRDVRDLLRLLKGSEPK